MKYTNENGILTIFLEGHIDSGNARMIENELNEIISRNQGAELEFDAENLEYVSSAGLRVLLKVRQNAHRKLRMHNVSANIYAVLEMTGFTDLLEVKKELRTVIVDPANLIGYSAIGAVYRLGKDEMIKVYNEGITLERIEQERNATREAFMLGVPCSIAYDTVKCNDSYGTIYELFNARTFSEMISSDPSKLERYAGLASRKLKEIHEIEVPDGAIMKISDHYHDMFSQLGTYFSEDEIAALHDIFNAVPEMNRFVHNDYHPKNIVESEGEIMIIDVSESGSGNPLIDLCKVYMICHLLGTKGRKPGLDDVSYIDMTYGQLEEYYARFMDVYFDGDTERIKKLNRLFEPFAEAMYYTSSLLHPMASEDMTQLFVQKIRDDVLSRKDELIGFLSE